MLWLFLAILAVAASPIGKAISDRLKGRVPSTSPMSQDLALAAQRIDDRIAELEDRLEHAERLLGEGGRPGTQFADEDHA